jgi:DNA-binding beta-propeller fold protein YncE
LEKEIALPGVEGRIDHFAVDVSGKRLFVAALGNGTVEALDLAKGRRAAQIRDLKEPQGLYFDGAANRLYVASGGDGTLRAYDGTTLAPQHQVELGEDADNVRGDPQQAGQIWVGYGSGGLAILTANGQRAGAIALASHPEAFQLEQRGSRVFVNVPKESAVAVADRTKQAVVARWGLGWAFANYPMALDEAGRRLFVGCRAPARLVVLDADSGQVVAKLPTVGDADDVFFDSNRRLVYVVGGEGAVDIVRVRDPRHYEPAGRTGTAPGARTGLFVPGLDRLFVAVPHRGSQASKVLVYRPTGFAP